jgi:hypothetical protein
MEKPQINNSIDCTIMACNCNPEKQTCNLCGKTISEVNQETTENAKNRQSYLKIVRKFNKRK